MIDNRLEVTYRGLDAFCIPCVVRVNGCCCSQHITSLTVDAYTVADSKLTAVLFVVESEILTVLVTGVVVQTHATKVVVLVETLHPVLYCDAVLNSLIVNRALATKLKAVAVAIVCVVPELNVSWLTVVVRDVNTLTLELVEPFLVSLIASVLPNIIFLWTIAIADAIFDDRAAIIRGRVSVEIPAII